MAYIKSVARKEFEQHVAQSRSIVLEAKLQLSISDDLRAYVFSNAVLAATARIEVYLSDLVSGWSTRARSVNTSASAIPTSMRAWLFAQKDVVRAFAAYQYDNSEKSLISALVPAINKPHIGVLMDVTSLGDLYAGHILAERKYPSPKNMKALLLRFGISNGFAELNKLAKKNVELLLTSLNDTRTQLAHEGVPPNFNERDVKRSLIAAEAFVGYVDRLLYKHLRTFTPAACWPN